MLIINVIMCYALWKVSDMYFEMQRKTLGWFCVIMSAFNAAVVMAEIF